MPGGVRGNEQASLHTVSHARQAEHSRTVWTDFHRRAFTSSVSVTSSPSFERSSDPQHGHAAGGATTTRSRGRCSGNARRAGRSRRWASPEVRLAARSEEHTSELLSLMRNLYAVLCVQKKT